MEKSKTKIISIIMIVVATIVIAGCSIYLYTSKKMIAKYDVNSFKLDKYEIPTFNSALKSKKKLLYANEDNGIVTLKYEIKNIKLNDVYAYLEKLSDEGYTVVNLENYYMRTINQEDDIQIKINVTSNHLIFEYKFGIDTTEKKDTEKNGNLKIEVNEVNKEQSK